MMMALSTEAHELVLYLENESKFYPTFKAIWKNLRSKMDRGTYSKSLAPQAFKALVDRGAKAYGKEFMSGEAEGLRTFTTGARREACVYFARGFEAEPD
jgi:hypothetical protein